MANFGFGIGSTGSDDLTGLDVDSDGSTIATGSFTGTVDFDPGAGTSTLTSAGSTDAFLVKYDSNGALEFSKQFSGTASDAGTSVDIDSSGNILLSGTFQGTMDADPDGGTTNLVSNGGYDGFFGKYNSSGELQWAHGIGGTNTDSVDDVAFHSSGAISIGGTFTGTVDADPSGATSNIVSAGNQDAFIAQYDTNGSLNWARPIGSTTTDEFSALAVDGSGNTYVGINYSGTVDFNVGGAAQNIAGLGNGDFAIAKYASNGDFVWAHGFGTGDSEDVNALTVDSSGNVYITGRFTTGFDIDPGAGVTNLVNGGGADAFVAKFDTDGNLGWAQSFSGAAFARGDAIAVDSDGNILISGVMNGTGDFDPGAGVTTLSVSSGSAFTAKFDNSGNFQWAKNISGDNSSQANAVGVDASGNSVTGGYIFNGTFDLDPGSGTNTVTTAGGRDGFLLKLDSSGLFAAAGGGGGGGGSGGSNGGGGSGPGTFEFLPGVSAGSGGTATSAPGDLQNLTPSSGVVDNALVTPSAGNFTGGQLSLKLQPTTTVSQLQVLVPKALATGSDSVVLNLPSTGKVGKAYVEIPAEFAPGQAVSVMMNDATTDVELVGTGCANVTGNGVNNGIVANACNNGITGGEGLDTVTGAEGSDLVYGNLGSDLIYGNQDNDTMFGGQDDDIAFGGQNDDLVYGNAGADQVYGNTSSDTLYGGQGDDSVFGGQGADQVFGGAGNDSIDGGLADDTITGGAGNDVFEFQNGDGADVIGDFTVGEDLIQLVSGINGTGATDGADMLSRITTDADGNAVIDLGDGNSLTLTGITPGQLTADSFVFL